jgi:uncharacterized protein (DUF2147 family)
LPAVFRRPFAPGSCPDIGKMPTKFESHLKRLDERILTRSRHFAAIQFRFSKGSSCRRAIADRAKKLETILGDGSLTIGKAAWPLRPQPASRYGSRKEGREGTMRLLIAAFLVLAGMSGATAQDVTGTWLSQTGETRVRIAACGSDLCGTVVWQKTPGKDEKNPDASKRNRPIVGLRMIFGMKSAGSGQWSGQLYNFQDGGTYAGKMRLAGSSALELSGCALGGLVCRSQTWTKVN